ncbi:type II toxin-antitoxin system toxin DNA ADP-ribosyl transferase DarT [Actinopolyspora sp. H202]|uniref:type II toxin-antitoxin system toxin DNA ADP-ribosyl transferase DarT n=1 Tax=Actinopolyspora sp. H202 TaxID=1500456 RepID=UPI003EE6AFAC
MQRPKPTYLYHFTSLEHLSTIVENGLWCDSAIRGSSMLRVEVGDNDIKRRRRGRPVKVPPGGVIADYVPFYFAPPSPMLFKIQREKVAHHNGGTNPLVYLVTSLERLLKLRPRTVYTDRNAVLDTAYFTHLSTTLDTLIDWPLMVAKMWANTAEEPDRKERRMAECLVHRQVPWEAFEKVVVHSAACARRVSDVLTGYGRPVQVESKPHWYF